MGIIRVVALENNISISKLLKLYLISCAKINLEDRLCGDIHDPFFSIAYGIIWNSTVKSNTTLPYIQLIFEDIINYIELFVEPITVIINYGYY